MKELNSHSPAEIEREGLDSEKDQVSDDPNCKDDKLAEAAEMTARLHLVK